MGRSCVWVPRTKNNKESILFKEASKVMSREDAKDIHASFTIPGILDKLSQLEEIKFDENGEPTLESINKVFPIINFYDSYNLKYEKEDIGAVNTKGETIIYDDLTTPLDIAKAYNKNHKNIIASVVKNGSGYSITVTKKTDKNANDLNHVEFKSALNQRLLGLMRRLGFTVVYDDSVQGIFEPLNAEETAEGLKTVVRIARGEVGEAAMPEEWSHWFISGMIDHPITQRLYSLCDNDDLIKAVLRDEYDKYVELYTRNGELNRESLILETMGQLLQYEILSSDLNVDDSARNLADRLWQAVQRNLKGTSVAEINKLIEDARKEVRGLVVMAENKSFIPLFRKGRSMLSQTLYDVSTNINKGKELAEKILSMRVRHLKIKEIKNRAKNRLDASEYKELKKLQNQVEQGSYFAAIYQYLSQVANDLKGLSSNLKALKQTVDPNDKESLLQMASVAKELDDTIKANFSTIRELMNFSKYSMDGTLNMDGSLADQITAAATDALSLITAAESDYNDIRFSIVYNVFKMYWGEDKVVPFGPDKGQVITLDYIMRYCIHDTGVISHYLNSMSDSPDILLGLIDKIVWDAQVRRNRQLENINTKLRAIHKKLSLSGIKDTSFMFEFDENGAPTGWLISDIDYRKFAARRRELYKELKAKGLKVSDIRDRLEKWEAENTTVMEIRDDEGNLLKQETVPKGLKPGDPYYVDNLSRLSDAQREYYDAMIELKATMDSYLPERATSLYKAVQIRNSLPEALSGVNSTKEGIQMVMSNAKDSVVRRSDDPLFGLKVMLDDDFNEEEERHTEKARVVTLDYTGEHPLKSVPIYYTRRLEDMRRLSTDFTGAMSAYCGMAINYKEMHSIADLMELARDLVHDRSVQQKYGKSPIMDITRRFKKDYVTNYTKSGGQSAEKLDDYLDNNLYDINKQEEGTIGDTNIDQAKVLDALKTYTSIVGLGFNAFSAVTNVTVGKLQLLFETIGNRDFSPTDSAKSIKDYWALLPEYLGEVNSYQKNSKLSLLIDRFNALEEFYESLRAQGKFKGSLLRFYNNFSFTILNNMGEHYLHCRTMLAVLEHQKVKVKGQEVPLLEALVTKQITDDSGEVLSSELVLEDGTTDSEGNALFTSTLAKEMQALKNKDTLTVDEKERLQELKEAQEKTEQMYVNLTMRIGKLNQQMNGAFNTKDRGTLQKYSVGRLILNFRQWMPAHYKRRFGGIQYDFALDRWKEGWWKTFGRFSWDLAKGAMQGQFILKSAWESLDQEEKKNIRQAISEISTYAILTSLISMLTRAGWRDKKKSSWAQRVILYSLYRMQLEVGSSAPSFDFKDNIMTLLKSPLPAANVGDGIINLFNVSNMMTEIKSGKYKGWTIWERDAIRNIPVLGKVKYFWDMVLGDTSAFALFDTKR